MKNKSTKHLWGCLCCLLWLCSCQDTDELSKEIDLLKDRTTALEAATQTLNTSLESLQALLKSEMIVGVTYVGDNYRIELNDGTSIEVIQASKANLNMPKLTIKNGYWEYSTDGGATFNRPKDDKGNDIPATAESAGSTTVTPIVKVNADGNWIISTDGGNNFELLGGIETPAIGKDAEGSNSIFSKVEYDANKQILSITLPDNQVIKLPCTDSFYLKVLGTSERQIFPLNEKRVYEVEQNEVEKASILAPEGWTVELEEKQLTIVSPATNNVEKEYIIKIVSTSVHGYLRTTSIPVKLLTTGFDANATAAWNNFVANNANNVLPDFSYAGYMHGEVAPPAIDLKSSGYTVYNVKDFGAKGDGKTSDRAALQAIISKIGRPANAKSIIYFPEGDYVLHTEENNNTSIEMNFGGFVLKGAGRDKTILRMTTPNQSGNPETTPPAMINIKYTVDPKNPVAVTGAIAPKGTFTVEVANGGSFGKDKWVLLKLVNNNPTLIQKELTSKTADGKAWSKTADAEWTNLINTGVQIYDYHQIANVEGNKVTFVEPLMHEVNPQWGWTLASFDNYSNIGVEDLTFAGNTQLGYVHHGNNYEDDNDYKPLGMMRLTNSWIRRVNFTNVSEALSISNSSNISAYDININGNRGHSAIRSGGSSRVFIGKVADHSKGNIAISETQVGSYLEDAGQFHSCGISKQSMGTVIWNVNWGQDACFEAHATQPRATLFDRCSGAFIKLHQGGAKSELPNHLDDLVLWNFNATNTNDISQGEFPWWGERGWNTFLPPTIVGFHGTAASQLSFRNEEVKLNESYNTAVEPYSLYEAQLRNRLGYVPAWINSLK